MKCCVQPKVTDVESTWRTCEGEHEIYVAPGGGERSRAHAQRWQAMRSRKGRGAPAASPSWPTELGRHRLQPGPETVYLPTAAVVVEIVSPDDETYDKLPFYAAHGVNEVLVSDPDERSLRIMALAGDHYEDAEQSPPEKPDRCRCSSLIPSGPVDRAVPLRQRFGVVRLEAAQRVGTTTVLLRPQGPFLPRCGTRSPVRRLPRPQYQ
jgi:hypothetical protein